MLKIKQVEIGSFKLLSNTTLDLENVRGLVSVVGENLDIPSFSSNSVAKTTLISAILQGFYGKNLQGSSIESCTNFYTGVKPRINIEFSVGEDNYYLTRDYQLDKLSFSKNGDLYKFPKKADINNEIEKVLGVSHFLLSNLTYISPSSNSLFSSANNVNQSNFIQSLLNLDFIDDIYKKVSKDVKGYKGELGLVLKELTIKQQQIENLNRQLDTIPEIVFKDIDSDITFTEENIKEGTNTRASLKAQYDSDVKLERDISKQHIELMSEIRHLQIDMKKESELITQGSCPTCGQDTSHLTCVVDKSRLRKLEREASALGDILIDAKASVTKSELALAGITSELTKAETYMKTLLREKESQTKQSSSVDIRESLLNQVDEAVNELITLQESNLELEKKVYILDLISECSSPKGFVKERVELFLKLYNLELQDLAVTLLGSEYIVEIIKTKSNHFELSVNDGEVTLPYSALSSGFQSRVSILLALALNRAVEQLTGISINVLFLDEVLSSIDVSGVEATQQLLLKAQKLFPNKIIFIVSHNQHLNMIEKQLLVRREKGESKLSFI